ncbi:aldehyde dehydrogenase family protein [Alkalispirochaeta alkalica]|uniref:aldehyde dehydrogenase family protein n=1 Tax=Alkalispirochaeta alkalica TaxID=46356 RepID=UPI000369BAEF|nr:aldehyde dehydrogenase family protein [Alkalispirochaeta alkalica]
MSVVQEKLARARAAQKQIEHYSQEEIDALVAAAGWEIYKTESAEACARLAHEETGLGVYEDKLLKHQKKILGTLRDLQGVKSVGVLEEDPEKGLIKIIKPVGVVGALIPVTNPTSSVGGNGLAILKNRNAVIFAPHPKGKGCSGLAAQKLRDGIRKAGGPEDLVQWIEEPTVDLTQELMQVVDLVVATGGPGMVKAAYSSGTPAYGVGAGNAVVIVDETADREDAARKIALGKTFDNATSCSAENSLVIESSIYTAMVEELKKQGGYLCSAEEKARLQETMWPDGHTLNRAVVAQSAGKIASLAGFSVPETTRFIMVEAEKVESGELFAGEKLSVVMTLWKYSGFPQAIQYVKDITAFSGYGHSCGIHTTREDRIMELGLQAPVSRIMVRQAQSAANSGNYDNGMPFSLTLGCGTWGGNMTTENIAYWHFRNVTWVSKPIPPVLPDEEKIFGTHWATFGR